MGQGSAPAFAPADDRSASIGARSVIFTVGLLLLLGGDASASADGAAAAMAGSLAGSLAGGGLGLGIGAALRAGTGGHDQLVMMRDGAMAGAAVGPPVGAALGAAFVGQDPLLPGLFTVVGSGIGLGAVVAMDRDPVGVAALIAVPAVAAAAGGALADPQEPEPDQVVIRPVLGPGLFGLSLSGRW